jgi:hypothetical protein
MEEKKGRSVEGRDCAVPRTIWIGGEDGARDISGEADRVAVLARMDRCMYVCTVGTPYGWVYKHKAFDAEIFDGKRTGNIRDARTKATGSGS